MDGSSTLNLDGATLQGHQATRGGAVYCAGVCDIQGTALVDNTATGTGGAIHMTPGSTLVLNRSDVFRNEGAHGGGVFARDVDLTLTRSSFCRNEAVGSLVEGGRGGGLRLEAASPDMVVHSLRLVHNRAQLGGGVYMVDLPGPIELLNLIGNSALEGAAVYGAGVVSGSMVGFNQGATALQPSQLSELLGQGNTYFDNAGITHPTLGYAQTLNQPVLRAFDRDLSCDVPFDYFAAGNQTVADAVVTGRTTPEVGAYNGEGIATPNLDGDPWPAVFDCDDQNPDVRPAGQGDEVWYNGIDENCDGKSDYDQDGDGYDAEAYGGDDCNDSPAGGGPIHPGALDDKPDLDLDCNGVSEETPTPLRSATCASAAGHAWWAVPFAFALIRRRVTRLGRRRTLEHPNSQ